MLHDLREALFSSIPFVVLHHRDEHIAHVALKEARHELGISPASGDVLFDKGKYLPKRTGVAGEVVPCRKRCVLSFIASGEVVVIAIGCYRDLAGQHVGLQGKENVLGHCILGKAYAVLLY